MCFGAYKMIADMHCDTISLLRMVRRQTPEAGLRDYDPFQVNLKKMRDGGYLVQNFAVFVNLFETEDPYEDAMELVRLFEREMAANQDQIRPVTTAGEIERNAGEGRLSAMLTLEEGGICLGKPELLETFYQHGARMMTLCWNYENELASPATPQLWGERDPISSLPDPSQPGLKEAGIQMVEQMESLGMIPDVSHLSDAGFRDVARICRKPFVASHSNARALCNHGRNLSDDMLRSLGEHGGVAGLNYYPEFVSEKPDPSEELKVLAKHARHMFNCGGRASVGLGSDFDGFSGDSIPAGADTVQDLAWALHREGFSDDETDDILYRNVLNLYREVLG